MTKAALKKLLNEKYKEFNKPVFIESDPILIPHRFTKKEDIEITAFFAAMFAWGQRKTIINKCNEIIELMDGAHINSSPNTKQKTSKDLKYLNIELSNQPTPFILSISSKTSTKQTNH